MGRWQPDGQAAIGRTTVRVLHINSDDQLALHSV